jgi:hypothetical protein
MGNLGRLPRGTREVAHAPQCRARSLAATAATAAAAARLVFGLVDAQAAPIEVRAIERADRLSSGIFLLHLDEGEAACAARLAVHDHIDRGHVTMAGEEGPEVALRRREGKVSNVDFLAQTFSSSGPDDAVLRQAVLP